MNTVEKLAFLLGLQNQNQPQGLRNLSPADLVSVLAQQQQQQQRPGARAPNVANMSPADIQSALALLQQQQGRAPVASGFGQMQSPARVGTSNLSGDMMLRRLEQFVNRDRLQRSGPSAVSDSDKSTSSSSNDERAPGDVPSRRGEVDSAYPMTDIEYPGQHDCMFGRGGGASNHIGNINFRYDYHEVHTVLWCILKTMDLTFLRFLLYYH